MNKPKIVRPEESQPARALWFDRKKYVTINFMVQRPREVQVDIQQDKMILCCKNEDDDVIYNELYFYDKIQQFVGEHSPLMPEVFQYLNLEENPPPELEDSRERVYDRSINLLIRKWTGDVAWPRLQKDPNKASWIAVDFDNWRDWANEEYDGKEEYDSYMDMMNEMSSGGKGAAPDMDDLDSD